MDEWFLINDLSDFTLKARAVVYNNFGRWNTENFDPGKDSISEESQDEFDQVLSHQESMIIVKQNAKRQKNRKTKKIRYIVNEKLFMKIVEDLNARMVSNLINSLVQKGLVETAFDGESNDFIFWIKDNDEDKTNTKEKPETD